MRTTLVAALLSLLWSFLSAPLFQQVGDVMTLSGISTSQAIAGDSWPGGDRPGW